MTSVSIMPPEARRTLAEVIESLGHGDEPQLSLAEVVEGFGERAFGALILVLALMSLFPWPPGGKAVFSAPIMLLSLELAIQRQTVWLPRWLLRISVSRAAYRKASGGRVLKSIRAIEALSRPRLPVLTGETADVITGAICFVLAIMLALPVPFGDMLPAFTIAIFGLAITQRDGLAVLIGGIGTVVCGIYIVLVWSAVVAIVSGILNWLQNLI
ncbi:exopolysaccharide biosynthesis protein [uncultured Brevundimonas sp.]|uniref:exopolysaccharide biosynthesis protein n=1 Tax=uncultured Brevundimonas sp. TaxID=213418 RepID=UPI0030EE1893|tara:strand:+ start:262 stop:903 length:642 start_codon:yes stop_codon:yes gene_type:complete